LLSQDHDFQLRIYQKLFVGWALLDLLGELTVLPRSPSGSWQRDSRTGKGHREKGGKRNRGSRKEMKGEKGGEGI